MNKIEKKSKCFVTWFILACTKILNIMEYKVKPFGNLILQALHPSHDYTMHFLFELDFLKRLFTFYFIKQLVSRKCIFLGLLSHFRVRR